MTKTACCQHVSSCPRLTLAQARGGHIDLGQSFVPLADYVAFANDLWLILRGEPGHGHITVCATYPPLCDRPHNGGSGRSTCWPGRDGSSAGWFVMLSASRRFVETGPRARQGHQC